MKSSKKKWKLLRWSPTWKRTLEAHLLRESDSEGTFHASVLPPSKKISLAAKAKPKRTKRTKREQDDEKPAIVFLQTLKRQSFLFLFCFVFLKMQKLWMVLEWEWGGFGKWRGVFMVVWWESSRCVMLGIVKRKFWITDCGARWFCFLVNCLCMHRK